MNTETPSSLHQRTTAWFQVLLGIGIVLGLALGFEWLADTISRSELPADWLLIRPPKEVSALVEQENLIWAGGNAGLFAIERHTGQLQALPGDAPVFRQVRGLLVDKEGQLWIAHRQGVTQYAAGLWQDVPAAPTPALSLGQDSQGAIWIGGETAVYRYKDDTITSFTTDDGLAFVPINVIFANSQGILWFGSADIVTGGLTRYDGLTWQPVSNTFIHPAVNAIIEDDQGVLWVGVGQASRGGAMYLVGEAWQALTKEDGLAGEKVRSLMSDRSGRLWFGSEYDGLAINDQGKWQTYTPQDGLAAGEVKAMLQDVDGYFWLGTSDGVNRLPNDLSK